VISLKPVSALFALWLAVLIGWQALSLADRTFRQALPGYTYLFPVDHASHEPFKTEWWYYTGHLDGSNGKRYGYELTFFRAATGLESPAKTAAWPMENLYLAHFAISDETGRKFHFKEQLNRGGQGLAGARSDTYRVWNGLWSAEQLGDRHVLKASLPGFEISLLLKPSKPPAIHGQGGVSQKADCRGCASHYYSITRFQTEGMLYEQGKPVSVRGQSWMDHEFGSNQLGKTQVGWDWFSLQLDDKTEVMLYQLRNRDGSLDRNSSGSLVDASGRVRHLPLSNFSVKTTATWTSPETHGRYPMGWQVEIPSEKLSLTVTPAFPNQELVIRSATGLTYWEGSARVRGTRQGKPVSGDAYVEMTGYASAFRNDI
jgi:predicted secreted hydrolase